MKNLVVIIFMLLFQSNSSLGEELAVDRSTQLPTGFVYLQDVDPSIRVDLKYATSDNFTGHPVDGYTKPVVILTKRAAHALKLVQQELLKQGYSLVVYDAYRPKKSVKHFVRWAESNDESKKHEFYPHIEKSQIIPQGYISPDSAHSRGSTVDVTIIKSNEEVQEANLIKRTLLDGRQVLHRHDNTLDMGTHFDYFGDASHHEAVQIDAYTIARRNFLKQMMTKQGFAAYDQEWWHYTLANEPFPNSYFDFDIR